MHGRTHGQKGGVRLTMVPGVKGVGDSVTVLTFDNVWAPMLAIGLRIKQQIRARRQWADQHLQDVMVCVRFALLF